MGGSHHITVKQLLGATFVAAMLLLPFGIQSCAMGTIHVPLFPMQMDAGAMQQCSENTLVHIQQLEQILGSFALSNSLLLALFCGLLCIVRERRRLAGIVDRAAAHIRLYMRLIRHLPTWHLPFFSFERVALPGLMPYKHPAFS